MEYTSARNGGPFAGIPQDIILREIASRLTIPEIYSLRSAVSLGVPVKSLPALFVCWSFLPPVRFGDIIAHVVSAYSLEWCISAGIVRGNSPMTQGASRGDSPLVDWCRKCAEVTQNLSVGILCYSESRGLRLPTFSESMSVSNSVESLMAGIALMCKTRDNIPKLSYNPDDFGAAAAILCLGEIPDIVDQRVLHKIACSDVHFVLNDLLLVNYASQIPGRNPTVIRSLAAIWRDRLPEDPRIYEILGSENFGGCLASWAKTLPEAAISSCYICNKHNNIDIVCLSRETLRGYLEHRIRSHAPDDRPPVIYSDAMISAAIKHMDLLVRAYSPAAMVKSITSVNGCTASGVIRLWTSFRGAIEEDRFISEVYSLRASADISPSARHLINPNGLTAGDIIQALHRGENYELWIMLSYGPKGARLLQDPRISRKVLKTMRHSPRLDEETSDMINAVIARE